MSDAVAIVLAAGLSRRMGAKNKLLLDVGDELVVRRVVKACAGVTHRPVLVVTGHESHAIRHALQDLPVEFIQNPDFSQGQMTSVDAGLRAAPQADSYILALGDQPHLRVDHLALLLHSHKTEAKGRITVPSVNGVRGNPIIIPARIRARMLADPVNLGCRNLTRTQPELVHSFHTSESAFVTDIDTPHDLEAARAQFNAPHKLPQTAYQRFKKLFHHPLSAEQADVLASVKFPCC